METNTGSGAVLCPEGTRTRARSLNPTRFLNREACREFLLEEARELRAHRFERVSGETLVALNEAVRSAMVQVIRRLPSKGKTI